jgi:cytochrome c
MKYSALYLGIFALSTALYSGYSAAEENNEMVKLATVSGCLTCHSIDPKPAPKDPNAVLPTAPAYRDVAAKYKNDKDAYTKLLTAVKQGSNPYQRHWQGKVSGLAMPPNVALKDDDAEKLVKWVLSLEPAPVAEPAKK